MKNNYTKALLIMFLFSLVLLATSFFLAIFTNWNIYTIIGIILASIVSIYFITLYIYLKLKGKVDGEGRDNK